MLYNIVSIACNIAYEIDTVAAVEYYKERGNGLSSKSRTN